MEESKESSLHFLDYWRVIRSRKEIILAVTLLVVLTGTAYTLTLPKIFMAEARMNVRDDSLDVEVFSRQQTTLYNPFFMRTQFQIIQSKVILDDVIREMELQEAWGREMGEGTPLSLQAARGILRRSLRVEQHRDTTLISIRVFRPDPSEAAEIANKVAEVYRTYRLRVKRDEVLGGLESLRSEMDNQRRKLEEAEKRLEAKRENMDVAMVGRGFQVDKIRLQQLEADRIAARVDMLVRQARYQQLDALEGEDLLTASTYIVSDRTLASLRQQLLDTDVNLKLLLENYGVNHPEVRRLISAREEMTSKMAEALNGLKKGLQADFEVAKAKYEALEEEVQQARRMDIEAERDRYLPFERAQREVDQQRSIFESLRARLAQEGIEMDIPRTPVEIVDHAEPPQRHSSPNVYMNIALSLFIGLLAGVGLAYFIEYLDTSVKTVDDVERHLSLPVLGVIPQKVGNLLEEGPNSPHAEAYRVLRTNIQFSNKGMPGGTFTFVSGGAGEGKSTTLFNMAYVCAQMGDKVLIVDSDLRRPVQHTFLGMPNNFGLTNVLLRDVPIEETIKATNVPNLHFLPSGKLPRSSVGLLESQRMRELVRNLKTRYDYVFFDSPPIVGVSDASILASEVDAAMLVVQYRKYPRTMSARAKRMLDNVGANSIGVVLNNINIMRDDYYYYYHSYYSQHAQPETTEGKELEVAAASGRRNVDTL